MFYNPLKTDLLGEFVFVNKFQFVAKMYETGIRNALARRHIAPEPNCKPLHAKGNPLGKEKLAPLFALYLIGCIMSLIIFVMENVLKPFKDPEKNNARLIIKMEAIQKELQSFSDDKELQLSLLEEVKSLYLQK